jgi:hypothetical protein
MDVHGISKAVGAFLFLVFGIIGRVELVELATWGGMEPLAQKTIHLDMNQNDVHPYHSISVLIYVIS